MPRPTVQIEYRFPYTVEALWQAWTDSAIITLWFGSDPNGTVKHAAVDPRPGGQFEITFSNADYSRFTCRGLYKKVDPPKLLIFTWSWDNEPGQISQVTVRLTPTASGHTSMDFTHAGIWAESAHDYEAGWKRTFEKLTRALAG